MIKSVGRWGDGEMGKWGDGEMGRWGELSRKKLYNIIHIFYILYVIQVPTGPFVKNLPL
ncbi:MAG: hypothetical protein F6K26_36255 [Moorea sp. SIO2I5]|nr:hypothetical protein [Moorena sp. SIO2I5]